MNEIFIKIISITKIDWTTYSNLLQNELGRNVIRELDELSLTDQDPAAWFKINEQYPCIAWKHTSVGFGIATNQDMNWIGSANVNITKEDTLYTATGNLLDWYNFCNLFSVKHSRYNERFVANAVYLHLRNIGFTLWKNHNKTELDDGTFILKGTL